MLQLRVILERENMTENEVATWNPLRSTSPSFKRALRKLYRKEFCIKSKNASRKKQTTESCARKARTSCIVRAPKYVKRCFGFVVVERGCLVKPKQQQQQQRRSIANPTLDFQFKACASFVSCKCTFECRLSDSPNRPASTSAVYSRKQSGELRNCSKAAE